MRAAAKRHGYPAVLVPPDDTHGAWQVEADADAWRVFVGRASDTTLKAALRRLAAEELKR